MFQRKTEEKGMKLKRITAALLAGVMCVGLLARCGSKGDGDEKGSGDKITIRLLTRMAGTNDIQKYIFRP